MNRKGTLILLVIVLLPTQQMMGWSFNGHRIIALIAESYLTPKTREAIKAISNDMPLEEISTWADEIRDKPYWRAQNSGRWHYLNLESGETYQPPTPPDYDVYTKLMQAERLLADTNTGTEERRYALFWLVHLVGDIHQPLHTGFGKDRGGNDTKLTWFGESSNLHRVWDGGFMNIQDETVASYSKRLRAGIDPVEATHWRTAPPIQWITEGRMMLEDAYAFNRDPGDEYVRRNLPEYECRIQMAAVRLAARLNAILDPA